MGKDKPRLGRGLASLVSQLAEPMPAAAVSDPEIHAADHTGGDGPAFAPPADAVPARLLALDLVDPNPYQPRSDFSDDGLEQLVASIREQGVVQPIVVRPHGQRFQLIAGQRRLEASRRAEMRTIPAVIRQADDRQMLEIALVENIHREDLNCVDRAQAYRRYEQTFGFGAEQIAERLGQDRTTVTNYLRLLALPDEVLQLLRHDRLSMGHARALAGLDNPSLQIKLAVKIVQQGLSVRQAEALVAESKQEHPPTAKKPPAKHPNILDLEQQMTRALSTRVQINPARKKGQGKIMIEFYSFDDFERIMDRICGEQREEL